MSLAIVPGSFDPMTLGHLALVKRVAAMYDRVVVAVMCNASKQYLFDMEARTEIARLTVSELSNVQVLSDSGMLIDLYDRLSADAVCKGYRNRDDLAYEREMARWNAAHNPRFHTILLRSEGSEALLSSTEVRRRMERGEDIGHLVSPKALHLILKNGISRTN